MTPAFLGQIAIFAAGAVPPGWAPCAGQLLPVAQNQALVSLLGMTYGGDGMRNFALPDLRGRVPIGVGAGGNFSLGQSSGEEGHALTSAELPAHQHNLMADASTSATGDQPSSAAVLGRSSGRLDPTGQALSAYIYASGTPNAVLNAAALAPAGGGQRHENRMPSLALNFCICIDPQAAYPSRD
jgi:microcystin-dependent protein